MINEDSKSKITQTFVKTTQENVFASQMTQEKLKKSKIFAGIKSAICQVKTPSEIGCGFFLNEKGLIATCYHAIQDDMVITLTNVTVIFEGKSYGVRFPCEVKTKTIFYSNREKNFMTNVFTTIAF